VAGRFLNVASGHSGKGMRWAGAEARSALDIGDGDVELGRDLEIAEVAVARALEHLLLGREHGLECKTQSAKLETGALVVQHATSNSLS
jgi:hypothetical protein